MDNRGGTAVIAAADPVNRSLRVFLDNVAEPPSSNPDNVKDWLRNLLIFAMEQQASALINLGGGSASLSAFSTLTGFAAGLAGTQGSETGHLIHVNDGLDRLL
jgi:hypothetical protein